LTLLALLPADSARSAEAEARAQPPYGVKSVRIKDTEGKLLPPPCRAEPNEYIYLEVINHSKWLERENLKEDEPLVLYLDGQAVPTLQPVLFSEWEEVVTNNAASPNPEKRTNQLASFGVRLEQNKSNTTAWKRLVRSPGFKFERPMGVSLGAGDGLKMPSWVYPMPNVEESPFFLVMLSKNWMWTGLGWLLAVFAVFAALVRRTAILRDPNLPLRPDGSMPFSLARAQMAFWFFLVIGSYSFLWLLTSATDTLNSSTIALIGISAATAVSSAFIDAGRRRDPYDYVLSESELQGDRKELLNRLTVARGETEEAIAKLQEAPHGHEETDKSVLEHNEKERTRLQNKQRLLEHQIAFFESSPLKRALVDLLADNGITSFHRFQMCVWTLVLGVIFVIEVYRNMEMPEFSATLLGLMGVSAGTFIGFKLPDPAKA